MKNRRKILRFFLSVKILYLAFNFIFYNQVLAKNQNTEESTKPTLLVDKIIESSQKNYPQILNFYEKVAIKEGKILESQGFFDVKIKNQ